jgi:hypothetical protein
MIYEKKNSEFLRLSPILSAFFMCYDICQFCCKVKRMLRKYLLSLSDVTCEEKKSEKESEFPVKSSRALLEAFLQKYYAGKCLNFNNWLKLVN